MKTYIKKLIPYLESIDGSEAAATVRDSIYACYQELHPIESEAIKRDFERLDAVLDKLTLKEYDEVWDLTVGLCAEHEKESFLEGIRVGIRLAEG